MKRICVFCGSNVGALPEYEAQAIALGQEMAARKIELVYGGGAVGLMGVIADAVLDAGGQVTGVIPTFLNVREVGHKGLSTLIEVSSMHERKMKMADLADGFISMPGGIGTLEELFEVFTWAQLGLHTNAVTLLNVKGYYDPLLRMLDEMVAQRFLNPQTREMLLSDADPGKLLDKIMAYQAPSVDKWLDRSRS